MMVRHSHSTRVRRLHTSYYMRCWFHIPSLCASVSWNKFMFTVFYMQKKIISSSTIYYSLLFILLCIIKPPNKKNKIPWLVGSHVFKSSIKISALGHGMIFQSDAIKWLFRLPEIKGWKPAGSLAEKCWTPAGYLLVKCQQFAIEKWPIERVDLATKSGDFP